MDDRTYVLPRYTGEFVDDQGPGCLETFKSKGFLMMTSGLLGFTIGCLTMGALLAVVIYG